MSPQFRSTYKCVLEELREADPEGLISLGAPPDEYAPEASDIAERIESGESIDGFVIQDVFSYWFGLGLMHLDYAQALASRIQLAQLAVLFGRGR